MQAIPLLKAAWERGVNTIDTANVYSNGESERITGKFIKEVSTLCAHHSDAHAFK